MASNTAVRTFPVSDVRPATNPLPEIPYHQAVANFLLARRIESCSRYHGRLVSGTRSHPLIAALHAAFAEHRPVCLTPDIIWLTILQGLAHHINANAEQLRRHFVRHEGKLTIKVRRDDFVKGTPENPWPDVFSEFSAAIREHIGNAHDLIVSNYSTTGPVERAASEVSLMDAMQAYFSYELYTLCGIPSITLEGTVEDWRSITQRVQAFREWGLEWWIAPLEPILAQFVAAAEGSFDQAFWDSIYKWNGPRGSGKGPYVSGWVLDLFPYLDNPAAKYGPDPSQTSSAPSFCRNSWLGSARSHEGPGRDAFPSLPSNAPFKWFYYDRQFDMEFVGGLIGVHQDPESLCLRPEIGWVILEASERRSVDQWLSEERMELFKQAETRQKEEAMAEQARLAAVKDHNDRSHALAAVLRSEGLRCPLCRQQSRDIRYYAGTPQERALFVCPACDRSFGPDSVKS